MFSGLRNMWKEARADVVQKHVADILARYERLGGYERYELTSAFDCVKGDLERENGAFTNWQDADKLAAAKQLLRGAQGAFYSSGHGASGAALLSLYLEAQTLPGDKAKRVIADVEEWHRRAVKSDLH
jgi:hypothetical protein